MSCVYEWCADTDDKAPGLVVLDEDDPQVEELFELIEMGAKGSSGFRSERVADRWSPVKVMYENPKSASDAPWVSMLSPAISRRAVECLAAFLEPNGELLPLECEQGDFFVFNVTSVADPLLRDTSSVEWIGEERDCANEIFYYDFDKEQVASLSVFRMPMTFDNVYVSEAFVRCVAENGLKGFVFEKIWPITKQQRLKDLARQGIFPQKLVGENLDRSIVL